MGENYSVADARRDLKSLVDSLTNQRSGLDAEKQQTEQQITSLTTDLETERYRLSQLTVQRDIAFNAYQALSNHEEETRLSLARNDQIARLASQALPPEEDVGPHSAINAAAAGLLGLIVIVVWVFASEWWRSSGASVPQVSIEHRETVKVK